MAFNRKGLVGLHYMGTIDGVANQSNAVYSYITNDDTAAVAASGYFNEMAYKLRKGDIIMCSLDNDGTAMLRNYVVASVTTSVVTIAAQNVA